MLWVDVPSAQSVDILIDNVEPVATHEAAEDGWRWTIEVPPNATRLEVRPAHGSTAGRFALALDTRDVEPPASLKEIEEVAGRDLEEARHRLGLLLDGWTGSDRVFGLQKAGNLARAARDHAAAESLYARGIEAAEAEGQWTNARQMVQVQAYDCIIDLQFQCARRWLDRDATLLPFETPSHRFYRGLLAERHGDLAEAALAYDKSVADSRALGDAKPKISLSILSRSLLLRAQLGDLPSAIDSIRTGLDQLDRLNPDMQAQFLNTSAWALLSAPGGVHRAAAKTDPRLEPSALLQRALQLLSDARKDDKTRTTALLNLAYDALDRDDPEAAAPWLDTLAPVRLPRNHEVWRRLLQARLARAQGNLDKARKTLQAMVADAERHEDHSLRWAARADLARVLEQLGRGDEALTEYAAAERILNEQLPLLGLGNRDRLMTDRDWATRRHVALRLIRGEDARALCVARMARTRVLREVSRRLRQQATPSGRQALDEYLGTRLRLDTQHDETFWEANATEAARQRREIERARQDNQQRFEALMRELDPHSPQVPQCDALSTPPPGTLDLHYVRLDDAWVGFSVDAEGTITHHTLDPLELSVTEDAERDPVQWARWGRALLDPFNEPIAAAKRVRVMPTGDLHRIPFHALPHGYPARALQDDVEVVYGLDLPRSTAATATATTTTALVLAPPSNLPHATGEARRSALVLRERGLSVESLPATTDDSPAEAPKILTEQVLARLPNAAWFHYTGHARARDVGGWDSELLLAGDETLTLGVPDILALPSVPPVVILDGCQTGISDPQSLGGGMSLAHAFVLGGSQVVLATTRAVRDQPAAALMQTLYESLDQPTSDAMIAALRRAQQAAAATSKNPAARIEAAWPSIRAWVP